MIPSTRPLLLRVLAAAALALADAHACAQPAAPATVDARPLVRLSLLARAGTDGDRVRLRDVVEVLQDDAHVAERLLDLDLGPAPRVGQPAHLRQAQFDDWLRIYRPAAGVRVQWSGATQVELERASQALGEQDLEDAARPVLDAWLASRSESHAIELAAPLAVVAVPTGRVSLSVRPLPRLAAPGARVTVWVDIAVGGHFERSVAVDYRVQAFRTGWVAAEELVRGQDLDAARLRQSQVDVAQLTSPLWTEAADNLRLRRSVHQGQPLTVLDAEVRPWVSRGQVVEVFSRAGDLAVEAQGEALQDGKAGQDVLVRIASSRAPLIGRVLKPGLVEIRQ